MAMAAGSTSTLKVMSWNLKDFGKFRFNRGQVERQAAQLEVLRGAAPDVLCLQELWDISAGLARLPRLLSECSAALGMHGEVVPAPRSHCHMALLWRPWITVEGWEVLDWTFHHGAGLATLKVGRGRPVRIGVTHLAPSNAPKRFSEARYVSRYADPEQITVVGGDWNCPGESDPEPDLSRLQPYELVRRVLWTDDPGEPQIVDRRAMQLLHRGGFTDVACYLNKPWQPTAASDLRVDAFRASKAALPLLADYGVLKTDLSNHFPIWMTMDLSRI
jgi:endonuclease/exonuclease/phosphatase family metal-dependent hydrolase